MAPDAPPGGGEKKPLIEYPTVYAFKVMGLREQAFFDCVRALFGRLMGAELSADAISEQVSKQGKYASLTVSVVLVAEEQRVKIYEALHREERIVYYL